MSSGEAIATCLRKYAIFSGRASRPEYWWWVLFQLLINAALLITLYSISGGKSTPGAVGLYYLVQLGLLLPYLAVTVRRLHDGGHLGWTIFWWFVPVVGWIIILVLLLQYSEPFSNEHGDPPF